MMCLSNGCFSLPSSLFPPVLFLALGHNNVCALLDLDINSRNHVLPFSILGIVDRKGSTMYSCNLGSVFCCSHVAFPS